VEARLPGAGQIAGELNIGPLGNQTIGDRRSAVAGFELPPLDQKSAVRNPGFEEIGAGVHGNRKIVTDIVTGRHTVLHEPSHTCQHTRYERRFERNRSKLFTFLEHDGVPWNNNNAEHAIKAFARLRRTMGGASTAKGMEEYLALLSISETCKARGGDTLGLFLEQQSTRK
jgi:hypothetical protein